MEFQVLPGRADVPFGESWHFRHILQPLEPTRASLLIYNLDARYLGNHKSDRWWQCSSRIGTFCITKMLGGLAMLSSRI